MVAMQFRPGKMDRAISEKQRVLNMYDGKQDAFCSWLGAYLLNDDMKEREMKSKNPRCKLVRAGNIHTTHAWSWMSSASFRDESL
jgi:hypothetical protein